MRSRRLIPYLVLAAGLLFTFSVSYRLAQVGEAEDRARFQALVLDVHRSIANRLENYTSLLRAGAGLFAASDSVEESEFRIFVDRLKLPEHYPGVQGMGFSIRVRPENQQELVEAKKRDGDDNFRLWPEAEPAASSAQGGERQAIIYLEPPDQRNRAGLGFDMLTIPTRRAAMERARDTGLPAATERVILFQQIDPQAQQPGFVIYAPVYKKCDDQRS